MPYEEVTDDAYARAAAEHFVVVEAAQGTLILRGPCPRCRTPIEIPVVTSVFRSSRSIGGWLRTSPVPDAGPEHTEPMMCTCEDAHPGRPQERVGCGAYWTLKISIPAP